MTRQVLTSLAGLSFFVPALFFINGGDRTDSILYPHPALVLIPMFFGLRWAALAVPTALFFAWNPNLFRGEAKVPKRSYVLLAIATLFSLLWFVVGWKDGLAFQGAMYNYSFLIVNILWTGGLWLMVALSRKSEQSFRVNLLFHWLFFAWLAWYAFPFFGEMI